MQDTGTRVNHVYLSCIKKLKIEILAKCFLVKHGFLGRCIRAFDWYQNQRPWITLNGHYALCFKMHSFLPRDARSAKRGIAIVSRPSVRPSVCP